jgi:hypothetical protein
MGDVSFYWLSNASYLNSGFYCKRLTPDVILDACSDFRTSGKPSGDFRPSFFLPTDLSTCYGYDGADRASLGN